MGRLECAAVPPRQDYGATSFSRFGVPDTKTKGLSSRVN